jgi:hypothetical protein
MLVHACNPSTQEAKVGWQVQDQSGLHSETLSQNNSSNKSLQKEKTKIKEVGQVLVANYSAGRDQEDCGSKTTQTSSS